MRYHFIFFLLVSCAWNPKEVGQAPRGKDLVDEFELKKDQLEKFKLVKVVEKKKTPQKKTKKSVKKKKTKTRRVAKKASRSGLSYPKDYPKEFIEYDKKHKKIWGEFKPVVFHNEVMEINVKYFGVTAGKIFLKTMPNVQIGNKESYHFYAKLKSAPFYSYIYKLDDYIESFVDVEKFIPLKYSLVQRESGQKVDDLQLFDFDKGKTYFWYKREKKGRVKEEKREAFIPRYISDSFSGLFFSRGLPFEENVVYEFPIITRAKVWLAKLQLDGYEKIEVNKKLYDAIRIKAETRFPGVLEKKGDILFWFSNDETRKVLKFRAKVKIGAIEGELVRYKEGQPIE